MFVWKQIGVEWVVSVGLGGGVERIKRKRNKMKEENFESGKACGSENLSKDQQSLYIS